MRKLVFFIVLLLSPLFYFAQFDYSNQISIGGNAPILIAVREYPPFPIVQLDFMHEFYFQTRNPGIVKSIETRLGIGAMAFPSVSLYMINLGAQRTYSGIYYVNGFGADLIAYKVQMPRLFADRIFGIAGIGKGNGYGLGFFYKFGRRISEHMSITTEIGGAVTMDYYEATFTGPVVWKSSYTPNLALYRGTISMNYHFAP